MSNQPPKWAAGFLRWFCKEEFLDEIEGDLFEMYFKRTVKSAWLADAFFIWNVIRSFRPINFKRTQLINNWTMNLFKNYTKIYFRRFRKEASHYSINIFGLAMGFCILFLILMFVYDEQNIDGFHSKKDRIFQVVNIYNDDEGSFKFVSSPGPLAEAMKADFPAIEEVAHLTYTGSQVMVKGDVRIAERDWAVGTASIFNILDFEITKGDPHKDFNGQAGVVITEDLAKRLFGHTDVVGEVLDESRFGPAEVLATMKEMPQNSSYRFSTIYIGKYDQWPENWQRYIELWRGRFAQTWVLLKDGKSPEDVLSLKDDFLDKHVPEDFREHIDIDLMNIKDIHLGSTGIERGGMSPTLATPYSDNQFVSTILLLGFLVIFIAALNYINLSSVQALKRTLEASMRKINGAKNRNLVIQLFYETFLTVIIAYALAILLIAILFPYFLVIANKSFELNLLFSLDMIPYHISTIMVIWVISGVVPALYYSKLKRSLLITKNAFLGKGDLLRKILVGIQYAFSIFLIIGSIVIYRQLDYIQNKDLGFNNEQLITLDINSGTARRSFKEILQGLKNSVNVVNASTSSRVPGEWKNIPTANLASNFSEDPLEVSHYGVDHNWLDTYGMKLQQGENFSGNDKTDSLSILINSKTVELMDLEEPIGKNLWVMNGRDSVRMKVIGIIEDFHYESLYQPIGPVVVTNWNNHIIAIDYFTIRYAGNTQEVLNHIEEVNFTFDPETPADINFLEDQWKRFYKSEESRATIMLIASVISIIVSAFGLFGLINFTVEQRTKEIGIRKVLGASFNSITTLVLREYFILLILAIVVAIPISWWLFGDWLTDFAYRINLTPDLALAAFGIVLIISFTTVILRIFRIARANPVQSIRYE